MSDYIPQKRKDRTDYLFLKIITQKLLDGKFMVQDYDMIKIIVSLSQ